MSDGCETASRHYSNGITLFDHGLYTEAIAEFDRFLKSDGQDSPEKKLASFYMGEAYAHMAARHLRMNMLARAEEELKFALVLHPEYADLHFNLALVYYRQARYEDAQSELQKALDINPRYARAHMYLGLSRLAGGQAAGMEDVCRAAELEPAYRDRRYDEALEAWGADRRQEALSLLEQVAETDIDEVGYHLEKGQMLLQQGMYLEAGDAFYEAVSICPHYADLRNYLGVCYLHQGMAEMAIAQFLKALEVNPGYVAARLNLASAYEAYGETDRCAAELRKVLEIEPGNPEAERRLGELEQVIRKQV